MPTPSAAQALSILRDGSQFQWYVIPLFALIVYVYASELHARRWNVVFAGLAYWGMDWFNEVWNGLVFHFTGRAPVWGAPGKTAFLILIGLNIEICFMFAIAGIAFVKTLPADPKLRVFGVPNRIAAVAGWSAFCVFVEYLLNGVGALTWDWPWWGRSAPWLIFLFGYAPFFLVAAIVHDLKSVRAQALTTGAILAFDAACLVLFGALLHWI